MIEITQSIMYILLPVLLALKFILFYNSTSRRSLNRFIYFRAESIYSSDTQRKQKAKILQNTLTIVIAAVLFLDIIIYIIFK